MPKALVVVPARQCVASSAIAEVFRRSNPARDYTVAPALLFPNSFENAMGVHFFLAEVDLNEFKFLFMVLDQAANVILGRYTFRR
jgi:hypothetical protein